MSRLEHTTTATGVRIDSGKPIARTHAEAPPVLPPQDGHLAAIEEIQVHPSNFDQKRIFEECTSSKKDDRWNLRRFEQLSFISLYNLQLEITQLEAGIATGQGVIADRDRLRTLLNEYSEALRNMEYLSKFPRQRFDEAFNWSQRMFPSARPSLRDNFDYFSLPVNTPPGDPVRSVLQKLLPARVVLTDASLFYHYYMKRPNEMPKPRNVSPFVDGLARIIVAITGGVFLLVPMIVMTWVTDAHIRLIIVSVAVLWFAISVALATKATNQELIGATAAYTAVLVVYVGTTSGSSGH